MNKLRTETVQYSDLVMRLILMHPTKNFVREFDLKTPPSV